MTGSYLDPKFEDILVHDILPGEVRLVPPNSPLDLDGLYPNLYRVTQKEKGGLVDVDRLNPTEEERAIITIPANSKSLLAIDSEPPKQRKMIEDQLRGGLSLMPPDDYLLMSLYPRTEGSKLVVGDPQGFGLALDQSDFHDVAMDMLRKLVNPVSGAILMHFDKVTEYCSQFKNKNSNVSQLVGHIIDNAHLTHSDVDELKNLAIRKDNFEFIQMLDEHIGVAGKFSSRIKDAGDHSAGASLT